MLFSGGKFQWKRLQNLIRLAKEGSGGLDLSDTVASGAKVVLLDEKLRAQLLQALTEDNRLHIDVRTPPTPGSVCVLTCCLSPGMLRFSAMVSLDNAAQDLGRLHFVLPEEGHPVTQSGLHVVSYNSAPSSKDTVGEVL